MAIFESSEFPGFAFNYDPLKQPFFKALVKENLRLIAQLPMGKGLLKAIKDAKTGKVTDQARYDAWQQGMSSPNYQVGKGRLIQGISAKTQVQ